MAEANSWWSTAVIYQIYPRSFQDSNDDGEGDLPGVISRLSYIAQLNVDAIWLSPFYQSPNKDGGYDISDPREVDSRFGNLEDAKNLIEKAHSLNLKVIFDIVPNHFSDQHQWFQAALKSKPGSIERSRFHFYDGKGEHVERPPCNWKSLFGGSAWTRVVEQNGEPGQWYLHLFDSSQPDLNWENPEVFADFEKTLRFWLDLGVDGFRVDVAHGLVKDKFQDHPDPDKLIAALRVDSTEVSRDERVQLLSNMPFFDQDGVHEIYRKWRKILDSYSPKKMAVAECFVYPQSKLANYVRADELDQVFNFDFLLVDWELNAIKTAINNSISVLENVGKLPTWALDNHDSPRVVSRLGSLEKATALALISLALPGSKYIYQGEELGLTDGELENSERQDPVYVRTHGKDLGRDGARVPIPWNSEEKNYGFSKGAPWLPLRSGYKNLSVNIQISDPDSTLNLYKNAIRIRKEYLANNSILEYLDSPNEVLIFKRKNILVVSNICDNKKEIDLPGQYDLLIANQEVGISNQILTMKAISTCWLIEKD